MLKKKTAFPLTLVAMTPPKGCPIQKKNDTCVKTMTIGDATRPPSHNTPSTPGALSSKEKQLIHCEMGSRLDAQANATHLHHHAPCPLPPSRYMHPRCTHACKERDAPQPASE